MNSCSLAGQTVISGSETGHPVERMSYFARRLTA
jgi:hypothetical protein